MIHQFFKIPKHAINDFCYSYLEKKKIYIYIPHVVDLQLVSQKLPLMRGLIIRFS